MYISIRYDVETGPKLENTNAWEKYFRWRHTYLEGQNKLQNIVKFRERGKIFAKWGDDHIQTCVESSNLLKKVLRFLTIYLNYQHSKLSKSCCTFNRMSLS